MPRRLSRSLEQIRAALAVAGDAARERTGKSRARQAFEMMLLRARGYSPDDYYTLRLYERVPGASDGPVGPSSEIQQPQLRTAKSEHSV